MIGALEDALRRPDSEMWCREGYNAAWYFEDSGLRLLEAFFESTLE